MYVQNFIPVGLFKIFLQLKVKVALFGTPTLISLELLHALSEIQLISEKFFTFFYS